MTSPDKPQCSHQRYTADCRGCEQQLSDYATKPQCPTCGSTDPRFMVHAGSYPTLCGNSFHDAPPSHQGDGGQAGATPCKTCDGRGFGVISDEYPLGNPRDCPNCNGTGVQTPKTPAKIDAGVSSLPKLAEPDTTSITPPTSFAAEMREMLEQAMADANLTARERATFATAVIIEAVEKHVIGEDENVAWPLDEFDPVETDAEMIETARNALRAEQRRHLHE